MIKLSKKKSQSKGKFHYFFMRTWMIEAACCHDQMYVGGRSPSVRPKTCLSYSPPTDQSIGTTWIVIQSNSKRGLEK